MVEAPQQSQTTPPLAARMGAVAPSPMLRLAALAARLRSEGRDVISLATGEPDLNTPAHVQAAAIAAMRAGDTHYTAADGTPAIKEAICRKFLRENGLHFTPDEVSVGAGAKQVIFNALAATIEAGVEVAVPVPYYPSYLEMTRLLGGTPVPIATYPEDGFRLTPEALESAITPATRWLILNAPGNPSGVTYSASELAGFADILRRHSNVCVISDDIYEHLTYTGAPYSTLAQVAHDLAGRILTVNGVSKAYCMTGWRIGYAAGAASLIRAMAIVQSQVTSCPSSVSQAAAEAALDGPVEVVGDLRATFERRRERTVRALNAIAGLHCPAPEGAFYALPDCRALIGRRGPDERLIEDDAGLAAYLIEAAGVVVVPGREFGAPGHLRLSFAADDTVLDTACRRIGEAVSQLH